MAGAFPMSFFLLLPCLMKDHLVLKVVNTKQGFMIGLSLRSMNISEIVKFLGFAGPLSFSQLVNCATMI